ncbi:MAG: GGDEF domain-containing protein [bacterium]
MTKLINSKPFFYILTLIFSFVSIYVKESLGYVIGVWGIFAVLSLYLVLIEQIKLPLPPFVVAAIVVSGGSESVLVPLLFVALPYIVSKLDQTHYLSFTLISLTVLMGTGDFESPRDFTLYMLFTLTSILAWLVYRKDIWLPLFSEKTTFTETSRKIDHTSSSIVEDPFKPLKNYLLRTSAFHGTKISLHLVELTPDGKAKKYNSENVFELRGLIHRVVHDKIELAAKTLLAEQEDLPMMPEYNFRLYYPISMFECSSMLLEPEYVLAIDLKIKEKGGDFENPDLKQELLESFKEIKNDISELIRQGEAFKQISIEKQKKENLYIGTAGIVDSFSRDSLFQATALAIFNLVPETGAVFITEKKGDSHIGHAFKIKNDFFGLEAVKTENIEEFGKEEITDSKSIHTLMINGKMDNLYELNGLNKRKESPVFTQEKFECFNKFESMSARLITINEEIKGTVTILTDSKEKFDAVKSQATPIKMIYKVVSSVLNNLEMYEKVEELSNIDGLTGLYNRRYFQEMIERMVTESSRTGMPLSIIMLDIDHFKAVNDTYGHKAGDDVIRFLSRTVKNNVRKVDVAARYGGEEFVVLLYNTNADGAARLAEKIRMLVKDSTVNTDGSQITVTSSFGVSSFPGLSLSSGDLVKNADEALYFSKKNGRNKVTVFSKEIIDSINEEDDE